MNQESEKKEEKQIKATVTEDLPPNQTLYVRNLNEKIKVEGTQIQC
jgi:RNA recognition motif-containing protein